MASNYKFSNEEMAAIKAARRETKDKRADARLKALELRAEGMELSEVSQATGFHAAYVSNWWRNIEIMDWKQSPGIIMAVITVI